MKGIILKWIIFHWCKKFLFKFCILSTSIIPLCVFFLLFFLEFLADISFIPLFATAVNYRLRFAILFSLHSLFHHIGHISKILNMWHVPTPVQVMLIGIWINQKCSKWVYSNSKPYYFLLKITATESICLSA